MQLLLLPHCLICTCLLVFGDLLWCTHECKLCSVEPNGFFCFHIMSWLNCATCACMSVYITLLSSLKISFVVRSCKKVVSLLINFWCSVVFCSVAFRCVVLWCVVLFIFFVLHLCCVGSIHYHAILHERADIAY